jgi:hypothetical protein
VTKNDFDPFARYTALGGSAKGIFISALNMNPAKKGSKTILEFYKLLDYERRIEHLLKTG